MQEPSSFFKQGRSGGGKGDTYEQVRGKGGQPVGGADPKGKSKGKGTGQAAKGPCFSFRDTGKCNNGRNCSYGHTPEATGRVWPTGAFTKKRLAEIQGFRPAKGGPTSSPTQGGDGSSAKAKGKGGKYGKRKGKGKGKSKGKGKGRRKGKRKGKGRGKSGKGCNVQKPQKIQKLCWYIKQGQTCPNGGDWCAYLD